MHSIHHRHYYPSACRKKNRFSIGHFRYVKVNDFLAVDATRPHDGHFPKQEVVLLCVSPRNSLEEPTGIGLPWKQTLGVCDAVSSNVTHCRLVRRTHAIRDLDDEEETVLDDWQFDCCLLSEVFSWIATVSWSVRLIWHGVLVSTLLDEKI